MLFSDVSSVTANCRWNV